ncbi:C-4 methylsterol oxidase [Violaceomyces palustris]|uniref:C-4 methylsterol oxidase n=1 Tax=Violaceomyces palustris TaxID=1673888 RepID=A0ACD0NPU0_9BASI|nr:C-4 methylsterol oxidase [Violaceomyces palustris]
MTEREPVDPPSSTVLPEGGEGEPFSLSVPLRNVKPVDLEGKPIPRSKHWGYQPTSWTNTPLKTFTFDLLLISTFIAFNSSSLGRDFYDRILQRYGDLNVRVWGTFWSTTAFYWFLSSLYAFVDLTGRPGWMFRYKVQPFSYVGPKEYLSISLVVLRNQFLVALPLIWLNYHTLDTPVESQALPGPWTTLFTILFDILCTEVGFYYIHRTLHSPSLYQLFHKQHHRYTAPVGLAATYCTVTEHVLSNLLPNILGTFLVPHHWSQMMFTFLFLEFGTISTHSGYNLPYLHSPLRHDYHHASFDQNYGPTGLLDSLHGTSDRFLSTLRQATERNGGDQDLARAEILRNLAALECSVSS